MCVVCGGKQNIILLFFLAHVTTFSEMCEPGQSRISITGRDFRTDSAASRKTEQNHSVNCASSIH